MLHYLRIFPVQKQLRLWMIRTWSTNGFYHLKSWKFSSRFLCSWNNCSLTNWANVCRIHKSKNQYISYNAFIALQKYCLWESSLDQNMWDFWTLLISFQTQLTRIMNYNDNFHKWVNKIGCSLRYSQISNCWQNRNICGALL